MEGLVKGLREGDYGGITLLGLLCQAALNDRAQLRRDLRIKLTGIGWRGLDMLVEDVNSIALKGVLPCEQLVAHDCQGILVAGGHSLSTPLFGGHVIWRAAGVFA